MSGSYRCPGDAEMLQASTSKYHCALAHRGSGMKGLAPSESLASTECKKPGEITSGPGHNVAT